VLVQAHAILHCVGRKQRDAGAAQAADPGHASRTLGDALRVGAGRSTASPGEAVGIALTENAASFEQVESVHSWQSRETKETSKK
jgi:hypothetical protein